MYPNIEELFDNHNVVFGIVYDVGDFPGNLMLTYPHDAILINGNIVLFKQFSDFQAYYSRAKDIEDLSLAFTCQSSLEKIKNAFDHFICSSRVDFEDMIIDILQNKLNAKIYDTRIIIN